MLVSFATIMVPTLFTKGMIRGGIPSPVIIGLDVILTSFDLGISTGLQVLKKSKMNSL